MNTSTPPAPPSPPGPTSTSISTSTSLHLDIGCYVVDALDPTERARFEAHLDDCESCRRELLEFAETSAELARLVDIGPPTRVRGAMLSGIRAIRPLPPVVPASVPPLSTLAAPQTSAARPPRSRLPGRRWLVGLVAVAAVSAALAGGVVVTSQLRPPVPPTQSVADRELDLLRAPDAVVFQREARGGRFTFVVSRQRDQAMLVSTGVPNPAAGQTYQLWTQHGDRLRPDATLTANTRTQWFAGPIRDAGGLAVTVEPAGGSVEPSAPILAQVTL